MHVSCLQYLSAPWELMTFSDDETMSVAWLVDKLIILTLFAMTGS
jgi:hypothetical protein